MIFGSVLKVVIKAEHDASRLEPRHCLRLVFVVVVVVVVDPRCRASSPRTKHYHTAPQRRFACRTKAISRPIVQPHGKHTQYLLVQSLGETVYKNISKSWEWDSARADASPPKIEQCSSRPVWSFSLYRRYPVVPWHANSWMSSVLRLFSLAHRRQQ
jgi:hypothetical protein